MPDQYRKPPAATNDGRSDLVLNRDDIEQSLTQSTTDVRLSATGQEHHAEGHRGDESEHAHKFGIHSRVGSRLHEELLAIEENDWQDGDEGGVLLIAS